ncbi:MAG TPA: DoxX family protein [Steroidobacteraceae bacterium]|nr:DoxX family protein [Steroidobacteraceae bacterium]
MQHIIAKSTLLRISGVLLALFGTLSVASRDFAFQWQPVPEDIPGREGLAQAIGVLEILVGLAVLVPRWRQRASLALMIVFSGWALLHLPAIAKQPLAVSAWLGAAEISALALGALLMTHLQARQTLVIRFYGVTLLVFGLSHFVYAEFTAALVPTWLPAPLFLAYLTGAIHLAAGIGLVVNFAPRIAAALEACMMLSFVVLLHMPRVLATPQNRTEWTMLLVASALTCSAFQVATSARASEDETEVQRDVKALQTS